MIPRKRLDIGWSDLFFGIRQCFGKGDRPLRQHQIQQHWSADSASLVCLSVRTGFDALLQTWNFPSGSEILVSAVTIRDMTRIIEAHGLVAVPVDLDWERLAVQPDRLVKAITPRSRAILVAHLFGSQMPMLPVVQVARQSGLLLIEDCAQAYIGDRFRGHPASDVTLFSFGPIKTATALGGGIMEIRNADLRQRVQARLASLPVQRRADFLRRLGKYAVLMALSNRGAYSLLIAVCQLLKWDHDRLISQSVRGFAGSDFFVRLRQQPSAPLLALLERRLRRFSPTAIAQRIAVAEAAIAAMPSIQRPGVLALHHSHWVFPILHPTPDALMHHLWRRGFDATRGASSLSVVEAPGDRPNIVPTSAQQMFSQLLYLPVDASLSLEEIHRLAAAVLEFSD